MRRLQQVESQNGRKFEFFKKFLKKSCCAQEQNSFAEVFLVMCIFYVMGTCIKGTDKKICISLCSKYLPHHSSYC